MIEVVAHDGLETSTTQTIDGIQRVGREPKVIIAVQGMIDGAVAQDRLVVLTAALKHVPLSDQDIVVQWWADGLYLGTGQTLHTRFEQGGLVQLRAEAQLPQGRLLQGDIELQVVPAPLAPDLSTDQYADGCDLVIASPPDADQGVVYPKLHFSLAKGHRSLNQWSEIIASQNEQDQGDIRFVKPNGNSLVVVQAEDQFGRRTPHSSIHTYSVGDTCSLDPDGQPPRVTPYVYP